MDSAYGEDTPPPELILGWQCKRWHCLPDIGAYFDQDYSLMHRITVLMNIHDALQRWQTCTGKAIHTLTDNERRIIRWLKDIGMVFN